jgi:pimeloyl-ACP methyl ester carboxylesterase
MTTTTLNTVEVDRLELAYRAEGSGPPVVLLHGWPTSSFLWRNVIPEIAGRNRVIAPDLPGFGASSKPLDRRYDFELFEAAIDGLLAELGVEEVALAGHDLGGPIAVHWTLRNPDRVGALALLNTLLYPDFDPSVIEFVTALSTPESRERFTSPEGLRDAVRVGLADEANLTDEVVEGVVAPFADADSRRALAAAGIQLRPEGFTEIAEGLPSLRMPVSVVYGARDRLLLDVAETMERLQRDVPQATVTALPECGHFLQEEAPDEVGRLLAEFFAEGSN